MFAEHMVAAHGPVELLSPANLTEGDLVLPVAMIGAPSVSAEKLLTGSEVYGLVERVERLFGRPVTALMAAEIGGMNGVLPIGWAAKMGLPLVDGDGMGRAFPRLGMSSMRLADIPAGPVFLNDELGNAVVFESPEVDTLERLVRSATTSLGGSATMALHVMTGPEAKRAIVPDTVSLAAELGRVQIGPGDRVDAVVKRLGGVQLMRGKVIDVDRRVSEGVLDGTVVVKAFGDDRLLRIDFQNENLLAIENGQVLAAVPDILTVVDVHHGVSIATEALRYGQRVAVLCFPCADLWRTDEALAVVGPEAFGYAVNAGCPEVAS